MATLKIERHPTPFLIDFDLATTFEKMANEGGMTTTGRAAIFARKSYEEFTPMNQRHAMSSDAFATESNGATSSAWQACVRACNECAALCERISASPCDPERLLSLFTARCCFGPVQTFAT